MELTTTFLAIWGAVISTILAFLKLKEFYRDRPNIRVTVLGGYKAYPKDHPLNPYGDKDLIIITAANRGRRPVTLSRACLLMPRGSKSKYLMIFDQMSVKPVELSEGKSHEYLALEEQVRDTGLNPNKYVACVIDATGRYFWSHNILIRFIKLYRVK